MQATQRGGLTGKARANRNRNRIQRIHAQQMLDEYLDADAPRESPRLIPLRGRAEFLPTIDSWTREDATFETGNQLELTLQAANDHRDEQTRENAKWRLATAEEADNGATQTETAACQEQVRPLVMVIPAPYWARPRVDFQPQGGRGVERTFDFKRFAYGCALGSAAAAAILLVVSVIAH